MALINSKVKAIINIKRSISGSYRNEGPLLLLNEGIKIYDNCSNNILKKIKNGDVLELIDEQIYKNGKVIASCKCLYKKEVNKLFKKAKSRRNELLNNFIDNTLKYAKKEKKLILNIKTPDLSNYIKDKEVLVVIRGADHRKDLEFITPYINVKKPVIIAVDGGADTCLNLGICPDIIIGDMDSVSDEALLCGSIIVVHVYLNGKSPALKRVKSLSLNAIEFSAPGTSEDIALLLAYENEAKMITAIGTHKNMFDFLEKGRKGMGSTLLVRLKIGNKLIDLSGINKIYRNGFNDE